MGIRRLRIWCSVLLSIAVLVLSAAEGQGQDGRVSRATLRELRKGIDVLEEAEEAILLSGEGLALAFERYKVTQARVGELLAGQPPGVRELIVAIGDAKVCDCADFRAAQAAYRISQEHYQKAAETFDGIASASPELADAHLLAGMARLGLSDTQGALDAFGRARALGAQKVQGLHLRDPGAVFEQPNEAWRLAEVARAISVGARMVPLDTRVPPLYGYGLAYGEAGVWFGFREGELRVPKAPPAQEEEDLFAFIDAEDEGGDDLFAGISETPVKKAPQATAPAVAPEKGEKPAEKPLAPPAPSPVGGTSKPAASGPAMAGISEQIGQLASLASMHAKQGACEEAREVLDALGALSAGGQLDEFSRAALGGAYFNLGAAYLKQRRPADALTAFEKARQFDPGDAKTHYCLGVIYKAQEDYARAAEALEQTVRLNPGLASAHFNLGSVYRKLEREPEAEKAFRAALTTNPQHVPAQYMLGLMAYTKGEWGDAVAAWKKVLEIDPDHKNAKAWLPKAEMRLAG